MFAASAWAAPSSTEAPALQAFSAEYRVLRDGKPIGRVQAELQRNQDGLWQYRLESEATALFVRMLGIETLESGWYQEQPDRIVPLSYHHEARRPGPDRYWQHRYDWPAGRLKARSHEGELEHALVPGLLDPLALRLEIVRRLNADQGQARDYTLAVFERDEIETQHYRYLRDETIEIDGRCYATTVRERFRKEGSSRNYRAWHAPMLNYLLVREAHLDDGKPIVLELVSLDAEGIELPPRGPCPPSLPSD
ncbi:MAG: DUF3108 domain-containing protein [Wenzhouxiangellaceae bacterium]|nr:DUF3108 domain-containing protein [Wenzhouxiangellaceae bacterium]